MDDFEVELKQGFLDEASSALADVEQSFLVLESQPDDPSVIDKIFRLAHNLKGSSRAVGFDEMGTFTHQFESLLLKIKNKEIQPVPTVINLLLRCTDHLVKWVDLLKGDLSAHFDSAELIQEIARSEQGLPVAHGVSEAPRDSEAENLTVEAIDDEILIDPKEIESLNEVLAAPEPLFEDPFVPVPPVKVQPEIQPQPSPKEPSSNQVVAAEESLRVSTKKLERLLNYVGELTILQSVLNEQALESGHSDFRKTVHQLGKVSKEIQDVSMGLRMVPIRPTFQKMQRIVRDTAQALGKDVQLVLVGEDTELDKTVLEKINDPLVHLVRNSVDHGVEKPEDRALLGKPAQGKVTLAAFHRSGRLIIEVKDDGGGINPEKLKQKAIQKGLIKENAALSEKQALDLVFAPSFSTKEVVTDISGRGVGMDVVKTNIESLQGDVSVSSKVGEGSTFSISLPLTLAIIEGIIVRCGSEKFVIPINHIHESMRPEEKALQNSTTIGPVLLLRGENLPAFRMAELFGRKSELKFHEMIALVIRSQGFAFSLFVDDIIGKSQVVVKQLGSELSHLKGVSGSTILGDGKPALIVEPQDLIKSKMNVNPHELRRVS